MMMMMITYDLVVHSWAFHHSAKPATTCISRVLMKQAGRAVIIKKPTPIQPIEWSPFFEIGQEMF